MDAWEWIKIAGAVLGAVILAIVVGIIGNTFYTVSEPAQPGYVVPGVQVAGAVAAKPEAPKEEPMPDFATAIPAASVQNGEKIASRCQQCHDLSKGGPNKIGPNLWDIVDQPRGEGRNGFEFSAAMKAKGGTWTYAELFQFLKNPQAYIQGTKMSFAGVPSDKDRLDLIAYLRSLADTPAPLPAAGAADGAAAAPAAAPAADAKAPAQPK